MTFLSVLYRRAILFFKKAYAILKSEFMDLWSVKSGRVVLVSFGALILSMSLLYALFLQAPRTFVEHSLFSIPEGATLSQISEKLYNQGYIISPFWFKVFVVVGSGGNSLQAGDYFFAEQESALSLGSRFSNGVYGLTPERVTIFEGLNAYQVAQVFEKSFPQFDAEYFVQNAPEGYLFPDTYFFLPNVKADDVIKAMTQNFDRQIVSVAIEIQASGRTLEDVVKMASILEGEARKFETRQIIAGILWKRIDIGMPLQVDTSFVYINGKNSFTLTKSDLKEDSPYNSYTRTGLPPTPISSPGLESIQAASTPIETPYFFFLTDGEGIMRYAVDHNGHLKNRRLYLGK